MIIIIDAYNILKQVVGRHVTEKDRAHFIRLLNTYHAKKKHSIIAIFDGGPTRNPLAQMQGAIKIVYSGKESADHYIVNYLNEHKNEDLLLVSSDRALVSHAQSLSIASIDALAFYMLLTQHDGAAITKPSSERTIKTSQANEPELDQLMRESTHLEIKPEDGVKSRKSSKYSLSKHERLLQKKIKKL